MSVLLPNNPPYTCAICGGEFLGHQVARNEREAVCFVGECGGWTTLAVRAWEAFHAAAAAEVVRVVETATLDAEPAPRGGDE